MPQPDDETRRERFALIPDVFAHFQSALTNFLAQERERFTPPLARAADSRDYISACSGWLKSRKKCKTEKKFLGKSVLVKYFSCLHLREKNGEKVMLQQRLVWVFRYIGH